MARQEEERTGTEPDRIAELKRWLSTNREALFSAGVTFIEGAWSGYGDDGDFEDCLHDGSYTLAPAITTLIEEVCRERAGGSFSVNGEEAEGGKLKLLVAEEKLLYESWFETREMISRPDVEL